MCQITTFEFARGRTKGKAQEEASLPPVRMLEA